MPRKVSKFEDFLAEAESASYRGNPGGCSVGKLLKELDNYDAVQLRTALVRQELTGSAIEKALKARLESRQVPSAYTIQRHRRGVCRCEETS